MSAGEPLALSGTLKVNHMVIGGFSLSPTDGLEPEPGAEIDVHYTLTLKLLPAGNEFLHGTVRHTMGAGALVLLREMIEDVERRQTA